MNKAPSVHGLSIRMPIIIPIKKRGLLINHHLLTIGDPKHGISGE